MDAVKFVKERKLGRISCYAREHGMTWQEAKEARDGQTD